MRPTGRLCSDAWRSEKRAEKIEYGDRNQQKQAVGAGQDGGFGLATMKERVESMGGRFAIASHPGDGTRVAVCVPCDSNG